MLIVLSTIWDFKVFTQQFVLAGGTQDRPTFMLAIYSYAEAFSPPPKYGLGSAIAVILTVILLVVTAVYVRMALRQGASDHPTAAPRGADRGERRRAGGGRLVAAFPVFWMISTSLKPNREIFSTTPRTAARAPDAGSTTGTSSAAR